MKICSKCGIEKKLGEFCKDKSKKDGLRPDCRMCRRKHDIKNKDKIKERRHIYYLNNKEIILIKDKKYYLKNKGKIIDNKRKYEQKKLILDIGFKLKHHLRDRFRKAIKNNYKSGSAVRDLGCSIQSLKLWLEQQFYNDPKTNEQMSWNNYGRWHIDHILPLSRFDLMERKQLLKACNWFNLRPMWSEENLKKSNKI